MALSAATCMGIILYSDQECSRKIVYIVLSVVEEELDSCFVSANTNNANIMLVPGK